MSHPLPRRAHQSLVRVFAEARRRSPGGEVVSGHHNSNLIAPLGQPLAFLLGMPSGRALAKFRTPLSTVEVVPRIWRYESEVLRVVRKWVSDVPRCLADFGDWSVHGYLPGRALAQEVPSGPVGSERLAVLAEFFARLADVPRDELPRLPDDWPADGDTLGFLSWLARFAEDKVHQAHRPRFGALFDAVGIPRDAMDRFMNAVPELGRRPFALLHTDVHRANVVVAPGPEGERLWIIDWELALYGDPLHDLATHVVRMDYDKTEQELMVRMWADAMERAGHTDVTADLDRDLPVYLGFEYAQSVYPDVMRAALSLPDRPGDRDLADAAERVCRAMRRAREPLALVDEPLDEAAVVQALRQWHAADHAVDRDERQPRDGNGHGAERTGAPGRAERAPDAEPSWRTERMDRHGC